MSDIDPGPWTLIPPTPYDGDDEELVGCFVDFGGIEAANGNPICMLGDPCGSATMFENMANAQLIVAAPDMLAALQGLTGILDRAESNASGNPEWGPVSARVNAARAALAKALGK